MRKIQSYVCRSRALSRRQQQYFKEAWLRYGIDNQETDLDFTACFGRDAPCFVEIGFGMGDSLLALAQHYPQWNFIGIEVHIPGSLKVFETIDEKSIHNIRIMKGDAVQLLKTMIAPQSLQGVLLFFSDPWPKVRHHKRRLVQPDFVSLVGERLVPQGIFHLATDDDHYADHMRVVLGGSPLFEFSVLDVSASDISGLGISASDVAGLGVSVSPYRFPSKFAERALKAGRMIHDLQVTRI